MADNLVPLLSKLQLLLHSKDENNRTLYDKGGVVITEADVTTAITEAGQRVSPVLSDLLTATPMTSAEETTAQTEQANNV